MRKGLEGRKTETGRVQAEFEKTHLDKLCEFLYTANLMGYGGEEHRGELISEIPHADGTIERIFASGLTEYVYPDGGTKVVWSQGDFRFSDKWFGGEPFGGITVVRFKGKACFTMNYHGEIMPGLSDETRRLVETCLKEALMQLDPEFPIRGPGCYLHSGATEGTVDVGYYNVPTGDLTRFTCGEWITGGVDPNSAKLYRAEFVGGLVNLR